MSWANILKRDGDGDAKAEVKRMPVAIQIKEPTRLGLINSKNDCFLHVILQVMITIPKFNWDIDHAFCREMMELKEKIYRTDITIFPDKIHAIIEEKYPNYLKIQQDVMECYYMLIDMLHEALKEGVDNEETKEEEEWMEIGYKSKAVQKRVYSFHKSPFLCFYGKFCNVIYKKNKISAKSFEPFLFLTLELTNSVQFALEQFSIANFKNNENTYFELLPDILTIQLSRFYFHKQRGLCKNTKAAEYPNILTVPCYSNEKEQLITYRLYAAIYHIGNTIDSGHYTCSLFDIKLGTWLYMDDTRVSRMVLQDILKFKRNEAYMLMYVKSTSK